MYSEWDNLRSRPVTAINWKHPHFFRSFFGLRMFSTQENIENTFHFCWSPWRTTYFVLATLWHNIYGGVHVWRCVCCFVIKSWGRTVRFTIVRPWTIDVALQHLPRNVNYWCSGFGVSQLLTSVEKRAYVSAYRDLAVNHPVGVAHRACFQWSFLSPAT